MISKDQYAIVAARRQGYDTLLWQTPGLTIAAQSFLLSAATDGESPRVISIALSVGALLVAFASLQFFHRLRTMEVRDSELLGEFEQKDPDFAIIHGKSAPFRHVPPKGIARLSAFGVWKGLLSIFLCLALGVTAWTILKKPALPSNDAGQAQAAKSHQS